MECEIDVNYRANDLRLRGRTRAGADARPNANYAPVIVPKFTH